MQKEICPAVFVVALVAALGVAVYAFIRVTGASHRGTPPPAMPPQVAADWAKYTQGRGAPGGSSTVPSPTGTTNAPPMQMNGAMPTLPNNGR